MNMTEIEKQWLVDYQIENARQYCAQAVNQLATRYSGGLAEYYHGLAIGTVRCLSHLGVIDAIKRDGLHNEFLFLFYRAKERRLEGLPL